MAEPEKQPAPLPEVDAPVAPVIVNGVEEYQSSEEFQRAHAVGLAKQAAEEAKAEAVTEIQRVKKVLDKYIKKHSSVAEVRKRIKDNGQAVSKHSLEVQFEVSDIVARELEKIKNELR